MKHILHLRAYTWSAGTITRTRVFPPRWYTRCGSYNREVTRVKKDVRVNLACCISGDELIPPISLWLSISVSSSCDSCLSLNLCLSSSLVSSCSLTRNVPSAYLPEPSLHTAILLSGPWLRSLVSHHPPTVEFLFIYGGFNEPWKSRLARCLLKSLERRYRAVLSAALCNQILKTW